LLFDDLLQLLPRKIRIDAHGSCLRLDVEIDADIFGSCILESFSDEYLAAIAMHSFDDECVFHLASFAAARLRLRDAILLHMIIDELHQGFHCALVAAIDSELSFLLACDEPELLELLERVRDLCLLKPCVLDDIAYVLGAGP
jgi:hypothetical protein